VLTDDEKRKLYDEHGSAFQTVGGKSRGPLRQFGEQRRTAEELFNKIFGESGKKKCPPFYPTILSTIVFSSFTAHPDFMGSKEEFYRDAKMGFTRSHEFIANISFEDVSKSTRFRKIFKK